MSKRSKSKKYNQNNKTPVSRNDLQIIDEKYALTAEAEDKKSTLFLKTINNTQRFQFKQQKLREKKTGKLINSCTNRLTLSRILPYIVSPPYVRASNMSELHFKTISTAQGEKIFWKKTNSTKKLPLDQMKKIQKLTRNIITSKTSYGRRGKYSTLIYSNQKLLKSPSTKDFYHTQQLKKNEPKCHVDYSLTMFEHQ